MTNKLLCKHGHKRTRENTIYRADGTRRCRICTNLRQRERWENATDQKKRERREDYKNWRLKHLTRERLAVKKRAEMRRRSRGIVPLGQRTHCKKGHEFTKANTRIDRRGNRNCRLCMREWEKASYHKDILKSRAIGRAKITRYRDLTYQIESLLRQARELDAMMKQQGFKCEEISNV